MPRADSLVLDRAIDEVSVAQEEAEEEGERERAGVGGEEEEEEEDVSLREEFFEAVESFKAVGRLSLDEPGAGMGGISVAGEPALDVDMEKVRRKVG